MVDEVLIARHGWTVKNWFGDLTWFFIAADREFGKNMVAESQRILQRARGARLREDWKLIHPFYLIEVKKKADVEAWDYYHVRRQVPPTKLSFPYRKANVRSSKRRTEVGALSLDGAED